MTDAEMLADRRRLKRRLSTWRIVAILAVTIALFVTGLASTGTFALGKLGDHVARIRVDGFILGVERQQRLIRELAENSRVKAIVVRIDSPGGTVAGAEVLYDALREAAGKKPVVAVLDRVAASGGYLVAVAADHVVALGNTTTGSIGVIMQWAQLHDLLENIGISMQEIKSGTLKGEPNPFAPMPEQAREITQEMVDETFRWFIGLIADRRPLTLAEVEILGDGRLFTGRQALAANLVDALGDERQARVWLENEHNISTGLNIVDWTPRTDTPISITGVAMGWLARQIGLPGLAAVIDTAGKTLETERLNLDGLLAVWHPHNSG